MIEWFSELGDRFYRSVIYDERYLYFLEGLKNTLLMAFFAAILGFVIATVVSIIRDYHKETGKLKILNAISNIYVYIIRGTPTLLQLMILYYVVFRSVDISIITVGVLTFGINSGAYVAEIIRAGFDGVSRGQKEAAKTGSVQRLRNGQHQNAAQARTCQGRTQPREDNRRRNADQIA